MLLATRVLKRLESLLKGEKDEKILPSDDSGDSALEYKDTQRYETYAQMACKDHQLPLIFLIVLVAGIAI